MATQMWLHSASFTANALYPYRYSYGDQKAGTNRTSGWQFNPLIVSSRGNNASGVQISSDLSIAGPIAAGIESGGTAKINAWVSMPLAADATISGTVTFNLWGISASMSANAGLVGILCKMSTDGTLTEILKSYRNVEAGTTAVVANWTGTPPAAVSVAKGERLVFRVAWSDAGGTMGAGYGLTHYVSGSTVAGQGDAWIQLTETLTFLNTNPTGTTLYLTETAASGITAGTAVEEKEMWTSRGSGSVTATVNAVAGWTAPILFTDTAGGNTIEWFSKPLTAFTLSGLVALNVRMWKSSGASSNEHRFEIAVCQGDGTSPVIYAVSGFGNLPVSYTVETREDFWLAGTDIAVEDGQRIRFRVYFDDGQNAAAADPDLLIAYGGNAGNTGDFFLKFSQTLTEFVSGPQDLSRALGTSTVVLSSGTVSRSSGGITGSLSTATVALSPGILTGSVAPPLTRALGTAVITLSPGSITVFVPPQSASLPTAILTLSPGGIAQTITHEASGYGGFQPTGGTTLTFPYTISAGINRLLVVGTEMEQNTISTAVSGVTFNGIPLTFGVMADASTAEAAGQRVELWYLLDANMPPPGTYNVVVTMAATLTGAQTGVFGGAALLSGVKQTAPEVTNSVTTLVDSTVLSCSVTTVTPNAWAIDVIGTGSSNTYTADGGQTERFEQNGAAIGVNNQSFALSTKLVASPGSTTLGWTVNTAYTRAAQVVAVWAPGYGIGLTAQPGGLTRPITPASVLLTPGTLGMSFGLTTQAISPASIVLSPGVLTGNLAGALTRALGTAVTTLSPGVISSTSGAVTQPITPASVLLTPGVVDVSAVNPPQSVSLPTAIITLSSGGLANILFDAVSTSPAWVAGNVDNSWSHTIGGGPNRLLVVTLTSDSGGVATGVTFNGVPMTKLDGGITGSTYGEMWYMLEAQLPVAGTYTVTATAPWTTGAIIRSFGSAVSAFGVIQSAPEANVKVSPVSSGTLSTNITTITPNAMVFDGIASETGTSWTVTSGQDVRAMNNHGSTSMAASTKLISAPGSTTISWSCSPNFVNVVHILAAWAPGVGVSGLTSVPGPVTQSLGTASVTLSPGVIQIESASPPLTVALPTAIITLSPGGLLADILHDATSSAGVFVGSGATDITFAHTISGGANRLLVVAIEIESGPGESRTVAGVTFNGVAMAFTSAGDSGTTESHQRTELWYMLEAQLPAAGTYNVIATFSAAVGGNAGITGSATSVTNAAQTVPEASNSSATTVDGTTYATGLTTLTPNAWVFDVIGGGNLGGWTPDAGQIKRAELSGGATQQSFATSTKQVAVPAWSWSGWTTDAAMNRFAHALAAWAPGVSVSGGLAPQSGPVTRVLGTASVLLTPGTFDVSTTAPPPQSVALSTAIVVLSPGIVTGAVAAPLTLALPVAITQLSIGTVGRTIGTGQVSLVTASVILTGGVVTSSPGSITRAITPASVLLTPGTFNRTVGLATQSLGSAVITLSSGTVNVSSGAPPQSAALPTAIVLLSSGTISRTTVTQVSLGTANVILTTGTVSSTTGGLSRVLLAASTQLVAGVLTPSLVPPTVVALSPAVITLAPGIFAHTVSTQVALPSASIVLTQGVMTPTSGAITRPLGTAISLLTFGQVSPVTPGGPQSRILGPAVTTLSPGVLSTVSGGSTQSLPIAAVVLSSGTISYTTTLQITLSTASIVLTPGNFTGTSAKSIALVPAIIIITSGNISTGIIIGGKPNVWLGTNWEAKPVKQWTGSVWVEKPMKVWTGSVWDLV